MVGSGAIFVPIRQQAQFSSQLGDRRNFHHSSTTVPPINMQIALLDSAHCKVYSVRFKYLRSATFGDGALFVPIGTEAQFSAKVTFTLALQLHIVQRIRLETLE